MPSFFWVRKKTAIESPGYNYACTKFFSELCRDDCSSLSIHFLCVLSCKQKTHLLFPKSSNFYHFLPLIDINLPLIRKFYTISGIIATPFLMVLHCSFPCFMGVLGFSWYLVVKGGKDVVGLWRMWKLRNVLWMGLGGDVENGRMWCPSELVAIIQAFTCLPHTDNFQRSMR